MQCYHHVTTKAMDRGLHKIVKRTMNKCHDTNVDIYVALLEIRSTLISSGLPSPATFNSVGQQEEYFIHSLENQYYVKMMSNLIAFIYRLHQ